MARYALLFAVVLSAILTGCAGSKAQVPPPTCAPCPTCAPTALPPTAMPTYTPYPTLAPPATYTPYPTYTVLPSVTPTPAPTATPMPELAIDGKTPLWPMTPVEVRAKWDDLTQVQQEGFAKEMGGQTVRWMATVYDVYPDGRIRVYFETNKPDKLMGSYVQVPKADLAKYSKEQAVTVEGAIVSAEEGLFSILDLVFTNVTVSE